MVAVDSFPSDLATAQSAVHVNGNNSHKPAGLDVTPIVDLTKTKKMDDIERHAILYTLQMTHGNVVEAARILGLGPATVYRKIKRYGVRAKSLSTGN
jgi:transcriptional regulator of acetoin/glycerol metabolism